MARFVLQRDDFSCAPTSIFNAARFYADERLPWKLFKRIERKCKTARQTTLPDGRPAPSIRGSWWHHENEAVRWLEERGFFKVVKSDVLTMNEMDPHNEKSERLRQEAWWHIEDGGTALLRVVTFQRPKSARPKSTFRRELPRMLRSENSYGFRSVHSVFAYGKRGTEYKFTTFDFARSLRFDRRFVWVTGYWLLQPCGE